MKLIIFILEILSTVEENNSKIDRARQKKDSLFQASIHGCIIANRDREYVRNMNQMIKYCSDHYLYSLSF